MTDTDTKLVERLRIKSSMIHMGEKIAWGSETALMDEAADRLAQLLAERDSLAAKLKSAEELVERAFRDGLQYATNVELRDPQEFNVAWKSSRIRTVLASIQQPGGRT
ncbi:MAG: hypothetical protein ABI216_21675 [Devosia sp.]